MKETKIVKNEKIDTSDINYSKYYYLYTKATAMIKVIDYLSMESKLVSNPIDIIRQEFILKYGKDKLNDGFLYNVSISCLIDSCKFLDEKLKINSIDLLKLFNKDKGD